MFGISYMLNPEYAGVLLKGKGILLLCIAFGLCMMGLYCIKKITTVRV
jgi:Flp pilus assembly protein TadB